MVADRPFHLGRIAAIGAGGGVLLLAVAHHSRLALEDDVDLLLVVADVVVLRDLPTGPDVDDVEAERLGTEGLAGEMPGRLPASLHLLELLDVHDRVALGHLSSSLAFPLSRRRCRTYPLQPWESPRRRVSKNRSGVTTRRGTTTTSTRSCPCTRRTWCSRTTRRASRPRASRSASTSVRSSRPGRTSTSRRGASTCATASSRRNGPLRRRTPTRCAAGTSSRNPPARGSSGGGST